MKPRIKINLRFLRYGKWQCIDPVNGLIFTAPTPAEAYELWRVAKFRKSFWYWYDAYRHVLGHDVISAFFFTVIFMTFREYEA